MQDFKTLLVWKKSTELILNIYTKTAQLPAEEKYNLTSQTRRAVLSISNNIAEGCGKFTPKDFTNFLQISLGSTLEVENCLIVSKESVYINKADFMVLRGQIIKIRKMLISLIY